MEKLILPKSTQKHLDDFRKIYEEWDKAAHGIENVQDTGLSDSELLGVALYMAKKSYQKKVEETKQEKEN